jgi:transposase
LLETTAETFAIGEVSADKAYLLADNVEAVHNHGGTPFIAPKTNTTGAASPLFARMFHFYCFNKDEFLRQYHRRSNVESTFSMLKAKFRDHLRS